MKARPLDFFRTSPSRGNLHHDHTPVSLIPSDLYFPLSLSLSLDIRDRANFRSLFITYVRNEHVRRYRYVPRRVFHIVRTYRRKEEER